MRTIIATWRMALDGVVKGYKNLCRGEDLVDALETAIMDVEANPDYISVGYGGLPNRDGGVELDSAIMDGRNLKYGAVMGIKNIKHPISVAKSLIDEDVNNILVGEGALEKALENGFKKENLLTEKAKKRFEKERLNLKKLKAYDGHDTVGMVFYNDGDVAVGTSTSGLFLKRAGRVGDSPIIGAGLYAVNGIGGAVATGVGEDIARCVLSYEIVRLMETGIPAMEATKKAVQIAEERYKRMGKKSRDISVVAIDKDGNWGAYTNIEHFSFVVKTDLEETVYIMSNIDGVLTTEIASEEWINTHTE